MSDDLIIGGHRFGSRFILGSGKFSLDITRAVIENGGVEMVTLSALTGDGIDQLELAIGRLFPHDPGLRPGALLTNARQAQAAAQARDCLTRAQLALQAGLSPDAVLTDVEDALQYLGQLTGRVVRDDITSQIFQRFCVGK